MQKVQAVSTRVSTGGIICGPPMATTKAVDATSVFHWWGFGDHR